MSIKQMEHSEQYCIYNSDEYKSVELVEDEKTDEEVEETINKLEETYINDANEIISALENIVSELKDVPTPLIQQVVDEMITQEDKNEMMDMYFKCFDNLPNDNEIKIYVLYLFNQLCMPITRKPENKIL